MPWKGWLRRSQPPWLKTQLKTEVAAAEGWQGQGHWRKGCIHQVQQVTMTETMRSSSRAPPCREVFLYLCGRCQPVAYSLKKVLARERSRKAPEGCCGAISNSKPGSGKTGLLAVVVFTQVRCPLHPWIPSRCLHAVCAAELGLCLLQGCVVSACDTISCVHLLGEPLLRWLSLCFYEGNQGVV